MESGLSPQLIERIRTALTCRDVDYAIRLLDELGGCSDPRPTVPVIMRSSGEVSGTPAEQLLLDRARAIRAERLLRTKQFAREMFGEPAWDMLLELYVSRSGARLSVTALTSRSGVTSSTGLRWLEYLEGKRLIERQPHPTDLRMQFVQLSGEGLAAMEAYLSQVRQHGTGQSF